MPEVNLVYRRDGSLAEVTDASGVRTFSDWSRDGVAQRETVTGDADDLLAGLDRRLPRDSLGRRAGYQGQLNPQRSGSPPAIALPSVLWSYEAPAGSTRTLGLLTRVSSDGRSVDIAHSIASSSLSLGSIVRTVTRSDAAWSLGTLETEERTMPGC